MQRKWSDNAGVHRKLKMVPHFDNPQKGLDVRELQKAINKRLAARKVPGRPLKLDGECGRHTVARGRLAARSLGIGLKGDGLTEYVQRLIREPAKRKPEQVKRGKHWVVEHADPPKVKVTGNVITSSPAGATDRDKIVAVCLEATEWYFSGKSHRFYSQRGFWTVDYPVTGESPGARSDCSQFGTSVFKAAGCKDPNNQKYTGGYTGTLAANATRIRREELRPGDLILYGTGTFHHVEVYIGDGVHKWSEAPAHLRDRTVGHGSPPVDFGDIDMMSQAVPMRPNVLA